MLDYDAEAAAYDATRGGDPRADAAASAVERLLPRDTAVVLDPACGTGIVTTRLRRPGRTVVGVDRSLGMLGVAAGRLPGRLAQGDATRLPIAAGSVDAVVIVWLLHLLDDAAPVVAEAARVLRPGGVLITTVDKDSAEVAVAPDLAAVVGPLRAVAPAATDAFDTVAALAAGHGLRLAGETAFTGLGQGRTPRQWGERLAKWRPAGDGAALFEAARARLAALPDQYTPRADPRYRLVAFG